MATFAALFVSKRNLRIIGIWIWLLTFVCAAGASLLLIALQIENDVKGEMQERLADYQRIAESVERSFVIMERDASAAPCSPAFNAQLRRIAYLPDGLNEFFYVADGAVMCSVGVDRFDPPVALGAPDFVVQNAVETSVWVDRDIGFAGLAGMRGTIMLRGSFATVVPSRPFDAVLPAWLAAEAAVVAPDGRWWHRGGTPGIHTQFRAAGPRFGWDGGPVLWSRICTAQGTYCVSLRADAVGMVGHDATIISVVLVFAGLLASWLSHLVRAPIQRYWSLEARFVRNLDARSVECVYQPIIDAASESMVGCEVLVRWRDVDGTIVYPDAFLPFVRKHDLTRKLTRLVVARAALELGGRLPSAMRLQINVNVFPSDLDAAALEETFQPLRAIGERFSIALEIIESDGLPLEQAQGEIETLRRAGFLIYIDDFGTGYSTMKHIAALDVDGVKLDKSFAMAPEGSVMAEMLDHAIGMVRSAGRKVVVEGVETAAKLEQLRAEPGRIDYLQGYHISRPLDIDGLSAFLRHRSGRAVETRRAA